MMRFNTDYIDFGMIHIVDTNQDYTEAFDSPYSEYVQKLKKEGIIRFIGASTHDAATGIKMVNTDLIDMVMFSINPAFDFNPGVHRHDLLWKGTKLDKLQIDPVRMEFYNLCAAKGVGITVMKALGAGRLLDTEKSNLGYALTLPQCISYALDRPAVSSVLLGAQTVDEVKQALVYENATPEERDYAATMQNGLPLLGGKCMYCNHCLPCPQGIDIAAVTKYMDIAKVSDADSVRAHYIALTAHGGNCIECGSCESNCPFNISVIENMKEAARLFGK
jgi:predicted aldo/keto reductase-like oxidoreductase